MISELELEVLLASLAAPTFGDGLYRLGGLAGAHLDLGARTLTLSAARYATHPGNPSLPGGQCRPVWGRGWRASRHPESGVLPPIAVVVGGEDAVRLPSATVGLSLGVRFQP